MQYVEQPVLIEDTAAPADVDAVKRAFARAGLEVEVAAAVSRRSADVLPWLVRVAVLVPVGSFFATFAARAADDAYAAVKTWVRDVCNARDGAGNDGHGTVELVDPDSTHVLFSSSLSDEAFEALGDIDWSQRRGDYLVWDAVRREWWDPTQR